MGLTYRFVVSMPNGGVVVLASGAREGKVRRDGEQEAAARGWGGGRLQLQNGRFKTWATISEQGHAPMVAGRAHA